jgi:hypothetical protein
MRLLLILTVLTHPAGNIGSGNAKSPANLRAAIPLFNNQFNGVLFEFFRVSWSFFLTHWTPRFLFNCS